MLPAPVSLALSGALQTRTAATGGSGNDRLALGDCRHHGPHRGKWQRAIAGLFAGGKVAKHGVCGQMEIEVFQSAPYNPAM